MIRFIDITEQYWNDTISHKTKVFSFLNTINDHYLTINGNQTWGYLEDLVDDIARDKSITNDLTARLIGLIPKEYERT